MLGSLRRQAVKGKGATKIAKLKAVALRVRRWAVLTETLIQSSKMSRVRMMLSLREGLLRSEGPTEAPRVCEDRRVSSLH